jgi:hypothetical protein
VLRQELHGDKLDFDAVELFALEGEVEFVSSVSCLTSSIHHVFIKGLSGLESLSDEIPLLLVEVLEEVHELVHECHPGLGFILALQLD